MMQFFGTIVTKEDPVNLELDEGDIFHLTKAVIHPKSQGKGKVYLTAVISLIDEEEIEDVDDEEESPREDEIEITIGILEAGKTDQIDLDLHYNFEQIVRFELQAEDGAGYVVALSGSVITMEQQGCDDEDCDDEQCFNHEDDEEIDSDEEFGDSEQEDEDSGDEEIPQLIAPVTKKGKITEIPEQPKKAPVPEPKKEVNKPNQPQQKKAAAQQPEKANNKPAAASPAKPQNNQSKNAPKQPQQQQQSPAKNNNNKRPQQNQNENNKKKSRN
ncbi:hypothetical protein ACTFIU_008838 [Dictyostelium citrinum]